MQQRFIAKIVPARVGGILCLALGFVALGVWIVIDAEAVSERAKGLWHSVVLVRLFGLGVSLFFLASAYSWLAILRSPGPVLEIDASGVRWQRWSDQRVPWSAVQQAEIKTVGRQRLLSLTLDNPAKYRGKGVSGVLAIMNATCGTGDMPINAIGTDRQFDEIVDAVARFYPLLR